MRFEWSEAKDRANLRKHDVSFEGARLVFEDPWAISVSDRLHDEEEQRFVTIGAIGSGSVLYVVHTWEFCEDDDVIRIISARAASAHERRFYEEAYQSAKTRYRRNRGKSGRGD